MSITDHARCCPQPQCPDQKNCARFHDDNARVGMNAMPYRVPGQECYWFVPNIREAE